MSLFSLIWCCYTNAYNYPNSNPYYGSNMSNAVREYTGRRKVGPRGTGEIRREHAKGMIFEWHYSRQAWRMGDAQRELVPATHLLHVLMYQIPKYTDPLFFQSSFYSSGNWESKWLVQINFFFSKFKHKFSTYYVSNLLLDSRLSEELFAVNFSWLKSMIWLQRCNNLIDFFYL